MKTIFDKYDKEAVNGLERALFQGRIEVVQSLYEAERAVKYLLSQPILGFDTETKPQFQRGHTSLVALLQVSSKDVCFLFRLNVLGLPDCIKRLLSDEGETLKIGLSWHDDLCGLRRRGEFHPGTFIEIQQIAKDMGLHDLSLQKLYANLMGKRISKTQRLSNWEADRLTDAQKQYAATDACLHPALRGDGAHAPGGLPHSGHPRDRGTQAHGHQSARGPHSYRCCADGQAQAHPQGCKQGQSCAHQEGQGHSPGGDRGRAKAAQDHKKT